VVVIGVDVDGVAARFAGVAVEVGVGVLRGLLLREVVVAVVVSALVGVVESLLPRWHS